MPDTLTATTDRTPVGPKAAAGEGPLLQVEELKVHFPVMKGVVIQKQIATVKAVDGVSFTLNRGETLGLVGESGSVTVRSMVKRGSSEP